MVAKISFIFIFPQIKVYLHKNSGVENGIKSIQLDAVFGI
jgi:hypothetical protein